MKRTRPRDAPARVDPGHARRRMYLALGLLAVGWASAVLVDVELIRTHVWKPDMAGISATVGYVVGCVWPAIWYGTTSKGKVYGEMRAGRRRLTAPTISGNRTIDLDALVSIRRFSMMGRGSSLDEYRLTDAHGVRLALNRDDSVDKTIRHALERAASQDESIRPSVTRHARSGLGLEPRTRVPEVLHLFWGFWMYLAAALVPTAISLLLALWLSNR